VKSYLVSTGIVSAHWLFLLDIRFMDGSAQWQVAVFLEWGSSVQKKFSEDLLGGLNIFLNHLP